MSPWQELGIAPTSEAGAIRKAYAARLKVTRPDEDPAGFARLRAAYEAALRLAPRVAADPAPAPPRADPPTLVPPSQIILRPPEQRPDPALLELPPAAQAALRNIVDALNRKANIEAARLLYAACEGHLLPLRTEFQLKDRLALALALDPELRTAQLAEIAGRFGWHGKAILPSTQANSPQARLAARIDQELARDRQAMAPPPTQQNEGGSGRGWIWLIVVIFIVMGRLATLGQSDPFASHPIGGNGYVPPASLQLQPLSPANPLVPPAPVPDNPSYWKLDTPFLPERSIQTALDLTAPAVEPPCQLDRDLPPPQIQLGQSVIFGTTGRLAMNGSTPAQNKLGEAYRSGTDVPQDYALALAWFRLAASHGNPDARRNLAEMCRIGLGAAPDAAAARTLYRAAAEAHDPSGQLGLGEMLIAGEGGDADPAAGFALIRDAADAGYVRAMAKLGSLYAEGSGTRRDPAKAASWTKSAALAGSPEAMQAYARLLEKTNKAEAYRWQALAIRFGATSADDASLGRLGAALSPKQRAALDKAVADWRVPTSALPIGQAIP